MYLSCTVASRNYPPVRRFCLCVFNIYCSESADECKLPLPTYVHLTCFTHTHVHDTHRHMPVGQLTLQQSSQPQQLCFPVSGMTPHCGSCASLCPVGCLAACLTSTTRCQEYHLPPGLCCAQIFPDIPWVTPTPR